MMRYRDSTVVNRITLGAFVFLFFLSLYPLHSQEVNAIEFDLEADQLEKKGDKEAAEEKRNRARAIRRSNFAREKVAIPLVGDQTSKNPHPFSYGTQVWLKGYFELGLRGNIPRADFNSGMDWALDNGRVALQAGSPYLPRNEIPYQNQSVLPFNTEPGRIAPKEVVLPTLHLSYVAENRKWGFEYSNLPVHGSYGHMAYGYNDQVARYNTQFQMYDHRLMFKVHEELDRERWFTWDFGMRVGGWQTASSFSSPTLSQSGDLKETARFVAPSAGFRLYQSAPYNTRIEFGSDVFYTSGGTFDYERRFLQDGGKDFAGNNLNGFQSYKVESTKPTELKISGIDLNLIYSFVFLQNHRLSFGAKTTGYTWMANESNLPRITGASPEAISMGIYNWYTTSAFYEADGDGRRASRYFSVTNFFIGYNYVF
jgi:hypothetical protein